jgi:hypothetical protein
MFDLIKATCAFLIKNQSGNDKQSIIDQNQEAAKSYLDAHQEEYVSKHMRPTCLGCGE